MATINMKELLPVSIWPRWSLPVEGNKSKACSQHTDGCRGLFRYNEFSFFKKRDNSVFAIFFLPIFLTSFCTFGLWCRKPSLPGKVGANSFTWGAYCCPRTEPPASQGRMERVQVLPRPVIQLPIWGQSKQPVALISALHSFISTRDGCADCNVIKLEICREKAVPGYFIQKPS